jgi:hypothetical protein
MVLFIIKKNSVAFIPQANYTDWATATCWQNLVPTFVDRGMSRGQRGLCSGDNVFPEKYELGFYIPEDGILHNHHRQTSSLT